MTEQEDIQELYEMYKEKYNNCIEQHDIAHLDYFFDMMQECLKKGAIA